jgi:CSLREA domain-containing protein
VDTANDPDPSNNGSCSLREAIQNANDDNTTEVDCDAGAGADTITFTVASITLTGNIFVTTDITIDGPITLDGGNATNIFVIASPGNGHLTTTDDVLFQNGQNTTGGAILMQGGTYTCNGSTFENNVATEEGGAIGGDGVTDINGCRFEGNSASNDGGAIRHSGTDPMTIDGSMFLNNEAGTDIDPGDTDGGSGGAIYTSFFTTITGTGFSGNTTDTKAQSGIGGGAIFNSASAGGRTPYTGLVITASAFSGNIAEGDEANGGAIFNNTSGALSVNYSHFGTTPLPLPAPFNSFTAANEAQGTGNGGMGGAIYSAGPTLILGTSFIGNEAFSGGGFATDYSASIVFTNVVNSTFSQNVATSRGGAIYHFEPDDTVYVTNVTIANNDADGGGGIWIEGDGDNINPAFDDMVVSNTIIANNTGSNCFGNSPTDENLTDGGGNLVFNPTTGCGALAAVTGNPMLSSTAELTFTLATILTYTLPLQAGSAALSAGLDAICTDPLRFVLNLDQRLVIRPQGAAPCDIGAYESGLAATTPTFTPTFTNTPTASFTPSSTSTNTHTSTVTNTPTNTSTFTPTFTDTVTNTPSGTATFTPTSTSSFTSTVTFTPTNTGTGTSTFTPTNTATSTSTVTFTPTFTGTATDTPTSTSSFTSTVTFTPTFTGTVTNTATSTSTVTFTPTFTGTATNTATATQTGTPTETQTPTVTTTSTATSTGTVTATSTGTLTATNTPPPGPPPSSQPPTGSRVFFCDDLERESSGAMTAYGSIGNVVFNGIYGNVFCRIIVQDDQLITNFAEIGVQAVIDMGVVQAVDLFGLLPDGSPIVPFISPMRVCLRGHGDAIFLSAAGAGRTAQFLPILADSPTNYACALIPVSGTVVLVRQTGNSPVMNPVGNSLTDCALTTTNPVNLRSEPQVNGTNVLAVIPYAIRLQALERLPGWYKVIYGTQQGYVNDRFVTAVGSCG